MKNKYMPCKDCGERAVGCHSNCPKYAKYRKIIEDKPSMSEMDVYVIEQSLKGKRR